MNAASFVIQSRDFRDAQMTKLRRCLAASRIMAATG